MTDLQAKKLIACMAVCFPTSKLDEDGIAVYVRMILDLEYDAANAAIARLIGTSKFTPTIAEIREAALAVESGEQRPGGHAWGEVCREAQRICNLSEAEICRDRSLAKPRIADPVAVEAARSLGWSAIRNRLASDEVATRARFIELYDKLAATNRRTQLTEGLPSVQRYRALQAQREHERLESAQTRLGKLLVLPVAIEGDGTAGGNESAASTEMESA